VRKAQSLKENILELFSHKTTKSANKREGISVLFSHLLPGLRGSFEIIFQETEILPKNNFFMPNILRPVFFFSKFKDTS